MSDFKPQNEWDFWTFVWKSVFAITSVMIVSVTSCTAYQTHLVSEAIKDGVDPMSADCGIRGSAGEGKRVMCLAREKKDAVK